MLKYLNVVGAIAVLVFATVSFSSAKKPTANSSAAVKSGGSLTFAIPAYPQNMDPYSPSVDIAALQIFDAWWEYLVRPSPDGSTYEPMLAASYTISPDQKTYTFKLRPGVKFSDGTPLTTEDVITSLKNAFLLQKGSQIGFLGPRIGSI